jgi:hypothetical protein
VSTTEELRVVVEVAATTVATEVGTAATIMLVI